MSGLMYILQPEVIDLPPDQDPNALAWFAQFSSGHLRHADQQIVNWAIEHSLPPVKRQMAYSEYLRLFAEAHWYE